MLDLDSLVMSPLGSSFIKLGIVVGFLSPFLKLGDLNLSFCTSHHEIHVPLFYSPESLVFKFHKKMRSLLVD
jgi:hypothetical protein